LKEIAEGMGALGHFRATMKTLNFEIAPRFYIGEDKNGRNCWCIWT
jgi:hypothetical protein